jgi:hypothetical protein
VLLLIIMLVLMIFPDRDAPLTGSGSGLRSGAGIDHRMQTATLINGFVLGWSVVWPPGPVNAEMLRRTLLPRSRGGGFWSAWQLGLGACTGDFLWALAVMTARAAAQHPARSPCPRDHQFHSASDLCRHVRDERLAIRSLVGSRPDLPQRGRE